MADGQRKGRSLSSLARNVDAHVGRRIRERRSELAVSRSQLAQLLKISQEQVRRYEAGAAAIVASRLHEIGHALGVPASHFFEGFKGIIRSCPRSAGKRLKAGNAPFPPPVSCAG